jgi:CheY-like chemotaxis protein
LQGNILLVEDEPAVARVVQRMLTRIGLTVTAAVTGQVAIEAVTAEPDAFDLVILDMGLPDMTGTQVYHALKGLAPDLKVVISSGAGLGSVDDPAVRAGIVGVLDKPYGFAILKEKLPVFLAS